MDTASVEYKRAFWQYLHNGTPIAVSLKNAHQTSHYIWRIREVGKVRSSHVACIGKTFSWDNPPSTGHPGWITDTAVEPNPISVTALNFLTLLLEMSQTQAGHRQAETSFAIISNEEAEPYLRAKWCI